MESCPLQGGMTSHAALCFWDGSLRGFLRPCFFGKEGTLPAAPPGKRAVPALNGDVPLAGNPRAFLPAAKKARRGGEEALEAAPGKEAQKRGGGEKPAAPCAPCRPRPAGRAYGFARKFLISCSEAPVSMRPSFQSVPGHRGLSCSSVLPRPLPPEVAKGISVLPEKS